jgi:hypothetical protein
MVRHRGERQKTMTAPRPRTRQPKQLDPGILQAEISSFGLHLAAGNKSAKTIRTYTEAVQWFAAAHLLRQDSRDTWEQVDSRDIQQWMTWLLDRYSSAYASNQYAVPALPPARAARTRAAARWGLTAPVSMSRS